jgi:hypothetical protein
MTEEQARRISMLFDYVHLDAMGREYTVCTLPHPECDTLEESAIPTLPAADVKSGIIATSKAWRADHDLEKDNTFKYNDQTYYQATVEALRHEVQALQSPQLREEEEEEEEEAPKKNKSKQVAKRAKKKADAVAPLWTWVLQAYTFQNASTHSSTMLGGEGGRLVLVGRGSTLTHFHLDYSGATCDAYEVSDVHVFMYMCTFRITSHV